MKSLDLKIGLNLTPLSKPADAGMGFFVSHSNIQNKQKVKRKESTTSSKFHKEKVMKQIVVQKKTYLDVNGIEIVKKQKSKKLLHTTTLDERRVTMINFQGLKGSFDG